MVAMMFLVIILISDSIAHPIVFYLVLARLFIWDVINYIDKTSWVFVQDSFLSNLLSPKTITHLYVQDCISCNVRDIIPRTIRVDRKRMEEEMNNRGMASG